MTSTTENHKEAGGSGRRPFDARTFERVVVTLIAAVVIGRTAYLLAAAWAFTTDDAYITLRYSRHLAEGHGITWNVGEEPVEGYSNFLFVILGAVAIKVGADPVIFFKILSCLALGITCLLLYRMARSWVGPIGATLPAIVLTLYEGTAFWTVSGLETTVYQMLVVASVAAFFEALAGNDRPDSSNTGSAPWSGKWLAIAGVLVCLVGMTRPEGPLIGIAMGAVLAVDVIVRAATPLSSRAQRGTPLRHPERLSRHPERSEGPRVSAERVERPERPRHRERSEGSLLLRKGAVAGAVLALSFAIPYSTYFAWRYNHFGRLLPNSFYCKMVSDGEDPLKLIKDFVALAWPALVFGAAAFISFRRKWDARLLVPALAVVLYMVVFYDVDTIISRMNRHFLTAYALLLVPATVGLLQVVGWPARRIPSYLREFAVALWLLAGTLIFVPGEARVLRGLVQDYVQRSVAREDLGRHLDGRLDPNDTFVIGDAGMVPYIARARVMDAYCLNSGAMTQPPIDHSPERFVDHILAREPEAIVVHSTSPDRMEPHTLLNVFPLLVERTEFQNLYTHDQTIGYGMFQYWIFERNDLPPPSSFE